MMAGASLPPKIGRLVPLLGSDHDGEKLATLAAISRVLDDAGMDWTDFGRALLDGAGTAEAAPVELMIRALWDRRAALSGKERSFVRSVKTRVCLYQQPLSVKQAAWLTALYQREIDP